jgi:hypothetical protein
MSAHSAADITVLTDTFCPGFFRRNVRATLSGFFPALSAHWRSVRLSVYVSVITAQRYIHVSNNCKHLQENICNYWKHGFTFVAMERQIDIKRAWPDFWQWIRTQPKWAELGRQQKHYLYTAEYAFRAGKLGNERVKRLLGLYAPDRYEFRDVVIIHE